MFLLGTENIVGGWVAILLVVCGKMCGKTCGKICGKIEKLSDQNKNWCGSRYGPRDYDNETKITTTTTKTKRQKGKKTKRQKGKKGNKTKKDIKIERQKDKKTKRQKDKKAKRLIHFKINYYRTK